MKKTLFGLLLLGTTLFAEVTHVQATPKFITETKLKIIDIRTEGEWIQTGVIRGSHLITFFDERGNYDIETFLSQLDNVVTKGEKFALIC
ncbi:MAG TPA: rhodanese-like domain-containing protein, partial [Campylobacterales bacterium]|nr:rhodanese-like domain-containing protein [Campylobacterales bacterium]HIP41730.1 rhodanese-like domain-containing protein [Campylobacterales bacterium]